MIRYADDNQKPNKHHSETVKSALRNDERLCRIKTERYFAVFDKSDIDPSDINNFIHTLDQLTDSARLLKNGKTSFVTAVTLHGRNYVIKRYNPKGLWHQIRHTLKHSRARRGWLNARRLLQLGIPTPRPAGFIEEYNGFLLRRSWLITELAPGPKLYDYLADQEIPKEQKTKIIDKVFEILTLLDQYRITHGDLKHANLIVTSDGPTLIDLDSLKIHKTGLFYLYHRKKDLNAFRFTP
ncbi:MAG: hypothetical protein GX298_05775 [Planctomycetes bacterium]|jgi:tRNA A-37 threonylcarbamoyl transferase component Bud32|nr:hypothetical protein [Planctomycetota bacterium]